MATRGKDKGTYTLYGTRGTVDIVISRSDHDALSKVGFEGVGTGEYCREEATIDKDELHWHCTRKRGHGGAHVANGIYVCAVWPQTKQEHAEKLEAIAREKKAEMKAESDGYIDDLLGGSHERV